jgi:ribosome-associated protein
MFDENAMPALEINTDHITLAQAVKMAGLADSGGQAKLLIRQGEVQVNGVVDTQPGRKLSSGDKFRVRDGEEWRING